uniref:Uncharacterized protein n=1 Tax=Piliocolobus tephrosceles TaxID=591936 RepID=A0A8C9I575_9PRIM
MFCCLSTYSPLSGTFSSALFNNPTSSSNSEANTDEGNLIPVLLKKKFDSSFSSLRLCALKVLEGISSEGPDGSFRCCR